MCLYGASSLREASGSSRLTASQLQVQGQESITGATEERNSWSGLGHVATLVQQSGALPPTSHGLSWGG